MVVAWLSISPASFPAGVVLFELRGAVKDVGEIGRDGDPYLLKIPSSIRSCMIPGNEEGWGCGWKIEGGFADIGIDGTIVRPMSILLAKWSSAREQARAAKFELEACGGNL